MLHSKFLNALLFLTQWKYGPRAASFSGQRLSVKEHKEKVEFLRVF